MFIVDPCWKEEQVMEGRITIILNIHKELCGIQKAGGVPLPPESIISMAKIAMVKVKELTSVLQTALKEDEVNRKQSLKSGIPLPSADNLMVAGIGTRIDNETSILSFHDGADSVIVKDDVLSSQRAPEMSSARYNDFQDFATSFMERASDSVISADQNMDVDVDVDSDEEQGAEMLLDEFD